MPAIVCEGAPLVLNAILIAIQLIVCVLLVVLVLLHSGKDAGMSSVTGFSFAAQASVMERPLTQKYHLSLPHHISFWK